ncbi:uncharacterized protein LOC132185134 [Corylus avellana]|uniref:uncharacterized protein LOC132185134 n=1 Tax=Corylus avellana TaxID=13451 RepID=UPI00286B9A12|nr:uncharacterized protein LOC132185134 [Corylus avellana]
MSKAYNLVEWWFLEAVIRKMGFDERWIRLVMMCVSLVHYAILINREPCGHITPTRGLRQGDLISPYLFLICAEALSSMVTKGNRDELLSRVPTSKKGPKISHLFFADDNLLFCRTTLAQRSNLSAILQIYEEASGQKMNNNKTSIFFSRNTPVGEKETILEFAGILATSRYEKYLGLPALVGCSRVKAFKSITERVWKRLQDWKLRFLSQAGKEILLKAVIQAIPSYCMSIFLLPKSLCSELNSLMTRFWWGHKEKDRKIAWLSWSKMGVPKDVWSGGCSKFQKSSYDDPDFLWVVEGMLEKCDEEEFQVFVVIVRRLWLRRNDFINEGSFTPLDDILMKARATIQEFHQA